MDQDEKDLYRLYRDRLRDRRQATTRRRMRTQATPPALSLLMRDFFKGDPQAMKKFEETKAIQAWPQVVGETAARVSRAERLRGNQLVVRVQDPLWMHQLYLLKRDLLKRYREIFPDLHIGDIYYARGR